MQLDEFRTQWLALPEGQSFIYSTGPHVIYEECKNEAYKLYEGGWALLTQRKLPLPDISRYDYIITKRKERRIPQIIEITKVA